MTRAATATAPQTPARAVAAWVVVARAIECAALFAGVPLLIFFRILSLKWMMLVLGLFGIAVLVFLLLDPTFDHRSMWRMRASVREMRRALPVMIAGLILMLLGTIAHDEFGWGNHTLLLGMPRNNTGLYMAIMLLYPLFSVYPQELIYRAFFFHRYAVLFRTPGLMIAASALAFGWAHLIFENVLAVALSAVGGALFAWTYHRSRALSACWLEHSIYGDWLFTVGLGWYFFTGSV
ncbi:MAG: CPBP family intramembrane metalloprotease [Phycisphaeraceae bacterium]|nr:CPBP family intramembrane metalloprotease [Phycisphaeraceae bacterium]